MAAGVSEAGRRGLEGKQSKLAYRAFEVLKQAQGHFDWGFLMTAWADGEGDSDSGDEGWTVHRSVGGSLGR